MYNMVDLYQIFDNIYISYYSIKFTISLFSIQYFFSYFLLFAGIKNESYIDVTILSQ